MTNVPMFSVTSAGIKDMYGVFRQFMGIPQDGSAIPRSLLEFGKAPADEAWVYTCMNIRAMNVAGIPLRVQVRDGSGWQDSEDSSNSAGKDLQRLLDDVNPGWEGSQLQAYSEAGAAVHGGSYWLKVRGGLGGRPQELYWLSGADVEPIVKGAFPEEYEYKPNGGPGIRYKAKDIVAHRDTVNLENPYKLLSPLSAVRNEIATGKAASEWNARLLENWGIPPGAWVADKDANIGPGDRTLIKRALAALRGPKNQGKVPILPGGLTWVPLSLNQKDADWIASRKVSRMAVCAAEGVPLVLAGDDEKSAVYASVRDAERVLWRLNLIPGLDRRASRIDSWLVPDFDKDRKTLRVRYDYSGIEALQPAPAENMAQWNEAVKLGVPLNRFIARFGMGKAVTGGDESRVYLRTGDMPLNNDGVPDPGIAPAPKPRPAEYGTQNNPKTLPKRLYQHEAVKAFIAGGDPTVLADLAYPQHIDALADGIRRRESAEQIERRLTEVQP